MRYLRAYLLNGLVALFRRVLCSTDLTTIRLRPQLSNATHVILLIIKNERGRIPFFLEYYRNLGIQHFLIIDNCSTDGTQDILMNEEDVSIFEARGGYKRARFGIDWANYIAAKYCANKWILHVDADEFLVFENCNERKIADLTEDLSKECQSSMQCVMVDMYSADLPSENLYRPGQDPLSICNMFDATGYQVVYDSISRTNWIKGGVRNRLFFEKIWDSPALNKTPLVYWKRHYAFAKSAHELWPPKLNAGGNTNSPSQYGVLLHFKFLNDFDTKLLGESTNQQHTSEYIHYLSGADRAYRTGFLFNGTVEYRNWDTLVHTGLISQTLRAADKITI